jgi:uncharacterized surface protein with fasciclin (FAS1) repeats
MTLQRTVLLASASALLAASAAHAQPASAPPMASGPAASPAPAAAAAAPAPAMQASPHMVPNGDIISTLQGSGHFTVMLKAINATNLTTTLKTTPSITLFAPTDEAFRNLAPNQLAYLMLPANLPTLQKVLIYHLVHLDLDSAKIKGAKGPVESVETSKLQLDGSGDPIKVNNADIIQADVRATNGIVQVVDRVLLPPDVTLPAPTG